MNHRFIGFMFFTLMANLPMVQAEAYQADDPLHPDGQKLANDISAQARAIFSQLAVAQQSGHYSPTQISDKREEIQAVLSELQKDQRSNPGYGITLDQAAQLRQELEGLSEQLPQAPSPQTARQAMTAPDNTQPSPDETPGFFQRFLKHKAHKHMSTNQGLSPNPNPALNNNSIYNPQPTPIPNPFFTALTQRINQLNQRVQGARAKRKLSNPQAQYFLSDLDGVRHQANDWVNGTPTQELTPEQADSLGQQLNTIEQRISSSGG